MYYLTTLWHGLSEGVMLLQDLMFIFIAFLALLRHATAVDERVTVTAGDSGYLLFVIPDNINVTSSTYRGCRFYMNDVLLDVIKRGENTVMCQNEEICKNMKFHVNRSQAMVEIPRTSVSDGGNYSVEFVFSGNDSNFKEVQWLNVIEGPLENPTPQFTPRASSVTRTATYEPSAPKRVSASASGVTYNTLTTPLMVCLYCLLMF